ncbi:MAG: hypothetical protein JXN59_14140 [Anaerolineae bacterium]|nr:hypothetical protein [Anaerolineae bacterium]
MRFDIAKRHLAALGGAFLILSSLLLSSPALTHDRLQAQAPEARVDDILRQMTTAQKVGQMFMVSLWGEILTLDGADFLSNYQPGGVVLFGYNIATPGQITTLTNSIQQTLADLPGAVPAWIAIDQEGGTVSRLTAASGFTIFPVNMAAAATNNPDYARAIGAAMAEELRAVGINTNLAPVLDIETNPFNPVIFRRAYSADPQITARMGAAMIEGLQNGGVMAVAKHFPGHGDTLDDSHVTLPVVQADRARLEQVELVPFQSAITANVGAIMTAHIAYPALDPTPDLPASLSPALLTGLLREEMGYSGLIMTDAMDMDAIDVRYSLSRAAVMSVQAGADLLTPGPHVSLDAQRSAVDAVIRAVEEGTIPLARIEDSARRILLMKERFNLLEWSPLDPSGSEQRINRAAHEQLVQELMAAAVTLVYDNTQRLPLGTGDRVALVYPATTPSMARTCETYHPDLQLVGVSLGPTDEEIGWAVSAAMQVEFVVVFTADAHLNPAVQRLVQALPPEKTVVVALRSPYDWQLFPQIGAYMLGYSPLPATPDAVCGGLFGARPVTGRTPIKLSDALPPGSGISIP